MEGARSRMKLALAVLLRFLAVVPPAASFLGLSAATLVVDPGGGGDFAMIQPAIDAASDGDTVLVKPGEYGIAEPVSFLGKAIVVRAEAGPEATTIRLPADTAGDSAVIFESGETWPSLLEGFTITGGRESCVKCISV